MAIESSDWASMVKSLLYTSKAVNAVIIQYVSLYPLLDTICSGLANPGPIIQNGSYNLAAHKYQQRKRIKKDFELSRRILETREGHQAYKFVKVYSLLGGLERHLIYHPNPEGPLGISLKWVNKPAFQNMTGRLYQEVCQGRIQWHFKVLEGDINPWILSTFGDDVRHAVHRVFPNRFFDKVARFIREYPHKDYTTYGSYICKILEMIKALDSDATHEMIQAIGIAMGVRFARFLHQPYNLAEVEIASKVMRHPIHMTVTECSNMVHSRLRECIQ